MKEFIDKLKLNKKLLSLFIISFVLLAIGFSYAIMSFDVTLFGKRTIEINNCEIKVNIKESETPLLVADYPISDNEAIKYEPHTIKLTNKSSCENIYFKIKLNDICDTCTKDDNNNCTINSTTYNCTLTKQLSKSVIKYQIINKQTSESTISTDPSTITIEDSMTTLNEIKEYELRLWITESATNNDIYVDGEKTNPKLYNARVNLEVTDNIQ